MNNQSRPEPVLNASYLAGSLITLLKLVLVMLYVLGILELTDTAQTAIVAVATALADVVIIIVTMIRQARGKVTPLESPQDAEGVPLSRPDGTPAAVVKKARA